MIGIGFLCHAKHDNVNMMARHMAAGFQANGVDFRLIDTRRPDAGKQFLALLQQPEDMFLCTYNNIGLPAEATSPLIRLLNLRQLPVFSWYLDHPVINASDFAIPLEHHHIGETSLGHLACIQRFGLDRSKPIRLMPHAVEIGAPLPWDRKDIPVLMVGTVGGDPEAARRGWAGQYGQDIADNLNRMIEVYDSLDNPGLDVCVCTVTGAELPWQDIRSYAILLDRYLRDRMKYAQAQLTIDCGGVVVGPGWADVIQNARAEQMPGELTAGQVSGYIARARTVFAGSPAYYASHERAFFAAAQGSVPIVTRNPAMAEWLSGGVIDLDDRKTDLTEDLRDALMDQSGLEERGKAARDACDRRHSYRCRTADILNAIGLGTAV